MAQQKENQKEFYIFFSVFCLLLVGIVVGFLYLFDTGRWDIILSTILIGISIWNWRIGLLIFVVSIFAIMGCHWF